MSRAVRPARNERSPRVSIPAFASADFTTSNRAAITSFFARDLLRLDSPVDTFATVGSSSVRRRFELARCLPDRTTGNASFDMWSPVGFLDHDRKTP